MANEHKRRIVRRVGLGVTAVLLLPVWYVAAWLVVSRAAHDRIISAETTMKMRPAFRPIKLYCDADLPGGAALRDLWWKVNPTPEADGVFFSGIRAEWLLAPNSVTIFVE
jgi:hypothetical protein